MNSAKSKQRKITDYFSRLPDKVSRTRSYLIKFKGTQTEGTQTEGDYEIEPLSKKKEGLKFLVYRFYNYESKKFSYSYTMCSIADEPVLSDAEETGSEDFDLYSLCSLALNHLRKIQRNTTYFEPHDCYEFDSLEPSSPLENSTKIDQVTQYGDDIMLDHDFWEGMEFMATKILEHEAARLNVKIDGSDLLTDWPTQFCDYCNAEGCEPDRDDSERSYECCSDEFEDSEESDSRLFEPFEYDSCPCRSGICECNKCECAENKRKYGEQYQKYYVWEAFSPGQG